MTSQKKVKKLSDYVGGGYGRFWNFRGRYNVCKGSRASKKSKTTALRWMSMLNKKGYEKANLLVVRKVYATIKDSCYTDLKWACNRLGLQNQWQFSLSPLEATNRITGQKILFRGLDDPLKVASITVEQGFLCWGWLEEAYEVMKEADFDTLDESIRGEIPAPLFKQWVLTFNPWNERHWIKSRFFDAAPNPDILATTTNYTCNEWLGEDDRKLFEEMKTRNPRRYQVAGLGNWGVVEGLVYENWHEERFSLDQMREYSIFTGLDFGFTNDPTAFVVGFIDTAQRRLFIWDELYEKGLSNRKIFERIRDKGYAKEKIIGDSAEPKSIVELQGFGLRISGARKGPDSIRAGVQFLQDYEIVIHPRCVHFLTEISNYGFKTDRFGNLLNEPMDDWNHCMDAMRYGCEPYINSSRVVHVNRELNGGI